MGEHGDRRELSHEERLTVKILRENGHSFPQIAKVAGCHYSTCIRIFNSFKKTGEFEFCEFLKILTIIDSFSYKSFPYI